jgi:hypothetical protein
MSSLKVESARRQLGTALALYLDDRDLNIVANTTWIGLKRPFHGFLNVWLIPRYTSLFLRHDATCQYLSSSLSARASGELALSRHEAYKCATSFHVLRHAIGDKVEAAYRRGDLFEKRRMLMAEWAAYCGTVAGADQHNIVALRAGAV